ncbi:MAG TPA: ABC transporter permease, partial [Gemmatimonadaceae bacterium]|nr:ABC transporter permease [Gemmatimonadaceae bacterium]
MLANDKREWRSVMAYGRLKPNVSVTQADHEIAGIAKELNRQYDPNTKFVGRVVALRDDFTDQGANSIVKTMFGAVTLVLLIACANVANLLLARAATRQREIAVRAAIGAGRGRIVRQLLTESLMLAGIAAAAAIPLTWIGLRLIDRGIPADDPIPWYFHWSVDTATLVYTVGIAVVASIAFGLMPALQVSRGRVYDALREGGGRGAFGSARRNKMRSALVVAEIALALVLLVGASLFTRTFMGLQRAQVGFDTSKIMTMRFYLPGQRYDSASTITATTQDLVQRAEALPNVEAATASSSMPFGNCCNGSSVIIEGQRAEPGAEPVIEWTGVSGHWFETLGIKLAAGRAFTDLETGGRSPVAVIDQRMADKFWHGSTAALGQRFRLYNDTTISYEVIGVVPTTRIRALDETGEVRPMAFLPYRYLLSRNTGLMLRVKGGAPSAVTRAMRDAIRSADPQIAVFDVRTMEEVRSLSFWQYKLFSEMFGAFGAIALLLAVIGVYGVISYGVSQRTQEFGVRVALGARGGHVFGMVLREAGWLAGIGVLAGVVGALGVTRVIKSFLIGVSPTDPLSFGSVALLLTAVALVASYVPARRATRIDPLTALRNE